MKKIIIILIIIIAITPFVVKPNNIHELYAPFKKDQYLLVAATMSDRETREFLELSWPRWLMRFLVEKREIDLTTNYTGNQSPIQFLLAEVFNHEEKGLSEQEMTYLFSLIQRALDQGANINNIADNGLAALHETVLFNSVTAAKFLIDNGANCSILIARPGKPIDGMSALELAEFLKTKDEKDRSEITAYLKARQECTTLKSTIGNTNDK